MTLKNTLLFLALAVETSSAFQSPAIPKVAFCPKSTRISAKKKNHHDKESTSNNNNNNNNSPTAAATAVTMGSFVEFSEKSRAHVGKILSLEHKTNGNGVLYDIEDSDGKVYHHVADKAISFSMPAPNSANAAARLFDEFVRAQTASEQVLRDTLEITPDLLEMAWEEATWTTTTTSSSTNHNNNNNAKEGEITPGQFIQMIHSSSHTASPLEKYMAWRLLKQDMAHVFFRELKQNGRVVAFKAKARKAVEAAKKAFCMNPDHQHEHEFCFM